MYESFFDRAKSTAQRIKALDKSKTVRLISHLDADGITAVSVLIKALNRENMKYSITIVPQLNKDVILSLATESYETIIFSDLGSGQIDLIKKHLADKTVFILDHHKPQGNDNTESIIHMNPHLDDIDGSKEISGAGVVYYVAEAMNEENKDMAHIAIVGAIGDVQEKDGFLPLNERILKTAVEAKKMEAVKGLRFFGTETRSLHKILEYSTDPYIPDVTGSENGAVQFLQSIGISPMGKKGWRKLGDLSKEELKNLVAAIIVKRSDEDHPEDVLGNNYILVEEEKGKQFRNAKEFATLLNACGRLGKTSFGIGVCLGDKNLKLKAIKVLEDYRKEIVTALRWYEDNHDSNKIFKEKGFIIINTEDNILATIVGTFASILSKSTKIKANTLIMGISRTENNLSKISLRIAGYRPREDIDLRDIVKEVAEPLGGEAGGHQHAAGALIETAKETEFIELAKRVLSKYSIEEKVV